MGCIGSSPKSAPSKQPDYTPPPAHKLSTAPSSTHTRTATINKSVEVATPTEVGEDWFYIDLTEKTQGPFSTFQMQSWFEGGLLPTNLLVRTATDSPSAFTPLSHRAAYLSAWREGFPLFNDWTAKQNAAAPAAAAPSGMLSLPPPVAAEPAQPVAQPNGTPDQEEPSSHPVSTYTGEPLSSSNPPAALSTDDAAASSSLPSALPSRPPRHPSSVAIVFPEPGKTYSSVLFPYTAEREDELTIVYNQIVEVVVDQPAPENWQMAKVVGTGLSGLIPGNYLKPLPDLASCPRAVASNDWVAADEPKPGHCLKLKKGDRIIVVERHPTGWWTGLSNGRKGMFPQHFCALIE